MSVFLRFAILLLLVIQPDTPPDVAFVVVEDGQRMIYRAGVDTPATPISTTTFSDYIQSLEISANGRWLALEMVDPIPSVRVLDMQTGSVITPNEHPPYALIGWIPAQPDTLALRWSGGLDIVDVRVGKTVNLAALGETQNTISIPRWSPDETKFALVEDRNESPIIYVVDTQIWNVQEIGPENARNFHPVWSPDGTQLLYTSGSQAGEDVYLYDFASGESRNLTNQPDRKVRHNWSPDGAHIVVLSVNNPDESDADYDLHLIDLATGAALQLGDESFEDASIPTSDIDGDWSPDSRWLPFVSEADAFRFYLYDLQTGDMELIRSDPLPRFQSSLWLPDGRLVYTWGLELIESFVYDPATGASEPFMEGAAHSYHISLSPTQEYLTLYRGGDGGGSIDLTNLATGERLDLSHLTLNSGTSWSPDGRWLTFSAMDMNDPNFPIDVYILDAQTFELHNLTNGAFRAEQPVWMP